MVDRDVALPHRRLAEVGIGDVDVGRRVGGAGNGLRSGVRVKRNQRALGDRRGVVVDRAGVRERIRKPHRWVLALEEADAAAHLGLALALNFVSEAEARSEGRVAIVGGVVAGDRDALGVDETSGGEARCDRGSLVNHGQVETDTSHDRQLRIWAPRVLHKAGQSRVGPVGDGVIDRETRVGLLEDEVRRGGAGEERRRRGERVVAHCVLHEGVRVVGGDLLAAHREGVVAEGVVAGELELLFLTDEAVQLTAVFGAEDDRAAGDRGAGIKTTSGQAFDADHRERRAAVGGCSIIVGHRYRGFRAEVGGPLAVELRGVAVGIARLVEPVIAQRRGRRAAVIGEARVLAVVAAIGGG